jgi:hypothetical protein
MTWRWAIALGVILLAAVVVFRWWPDPEERRFFLTTGQPEVVAKPNNTLPSTTVEAAPRQPVGSPLAARLSATDGSGQEDVQTLHALVVQYLQALQRRQGPPIGDDMDLAKILKGKNPLKRPVVDPTHSAFSPDGHILDRWGTPYHIHALSSTAYRIRSAGPDHQLFTKDDLLAPQ